MSEHRIAIYPGTFDPITNGHLDILGRATDIFDEVIVLLAGNPSKDHLFTLEEREAMAREAVEAWELNGKVKVSTFHGLSVEGADKYGAIALIRGLRAVSDFEFEHQMALMNRHLAPRLHTVYLMPKEEYTYLSSTIIKGVARHGGDIRKFVPPGVQRRLFDHFNIPEDQRNQRLD